MALTVRQSTQFRQDISIVLSRKNYSLRVLAVTRSYLDKLWFFTKSPTFLTRYSLFLQIAIKMS